MLTMAIAKGRMQAKALALLARAGVRASVEALASRRLAVEDESGRFRFVFVKPSDVPVYVEHGIADCGVVGRDVLLETGADVLQPLDLKISRCRIAVAAREAEPRGRRRGRGSSLIELIERGEDERRRAKLARIKGRSVSLDEELMRAVAEIIEEVRARGDAALLDYTARFDGVRLKAAELRIGAAALRESAARVDASVLEALRASIRNVRAFHERERVEGWEMEAGRGVRLGQRVTPVESAGLYVPGGTASYPSSVVMNVVPAQVAGVGRIVVVTPPRTLAETPAVAAALVELGVEEIYTVGGAQAVAALAYGTETIPREKIVRRSLADYGAIIVVGDIEEAYAIVNELAPEHLEIVVRDEEAAASRVLHAGAIFFGAYAPEAVGDYFAGPNHVLPTGGAARFSSALGVSDFQRRMSIIRYTRDELNESGRMIVALARAEGLDAHARSALIRMEG
ncbi:MAG: ATP phosphoribosyltransferase [Acidobacteria bacterium]|nr:ATP phosphoribosyltransferase [Acidobacteriota bacterium]